MQLKKFKKIMVVAFIFLTFAVTGCSRATGLSENEEYLAYFVNTTDLTRIVIEGDFYQLPEPFSVFIERGWEITARSLERQNMSDIERVYLPAHASMEFDLTLGDTEITVVVVNPDDENMMNLLDSTVVRLIGGRRNQPDSIVVYGGITIGTVPAGVQSVLGNFSYRNRINDNSNFYITGGSNHHEEMNLGIISPPGENTAVSSITITLGGSYNPRLFTPFTAPDTISANEFMENSYYLAGTVIGVTDMLFTFGSTTVPFGDVILAISDDGEIFAITTNNLTSTAESGFLIENVAFEDRVVGYSVDPIGRIEFDGEQIPLMRNTQIMIVNEDIFVVSTADVLIDN